LLASDPEAARPLGSVFKDNKVMHTRMVRKGDTFTSTVRVPPGMKLDYKFFITKTSRRAPISIWRTTLAKNILRSLETIAA